MIVPLLAYGVIDAIFTVIWKFVTGDKDFVVAIAQGSITINGDAAQAVVFCKTMFG